MAMNVRLGIDCGSVSLNLAMLRDGYEEPLTIYRRTLGRPLETFIQAADELIGMSAGSPSLTHALVTGSARDLLSQALDIPAVNEITAHASGIHHVDPRVRTVIEIGGQDSKFISIESSDGDGAVRVNAFRMNEICAAGTGAFLDEQAGRLGIPVESFGATALQSNNPAAIAGRCAVFAKTDMIHRAQEGTPLPDILLGLAFALARNYVSNLIKGDSLRPVVSLQGGVMSNTAVVQAFQSVLGLSRDEVTIPPYFTVLGALGCAVQAPRHGVVSAGLTLESLKERAAEALKNPTPCSTLEPLETPRRPDPVLEVRDPKADRRDLPLILGLDVGSVSVKGVLIDGSGRILDEDYRLSRSRLFECAEEVLNSIGDGEGRPQMIAVTGSGRELIGSLLDADLIVNEISAQTRAALSYDATVETVVEIGGQDSKWIRLEEGALKQFEMNRVCAAGTGSFLMEQGDRIGVSVEGALSEAAFASPRPADLGNRCTVFMESDLIHHQNSGASTKDLAAGVCISVVRNYVESVVGERSVGDNVLFLGGVAAIPAVRAAFEQVTGKVFHSPRFYRVSGALGAALKALDAVATGHLIPRERRRTLEDLSKIKRESFQCRGCTNQCQVDRYYPNGRLVFHGGLCDRWEVEQGRGRGGNDAGLFGVRSKLLEDLHGAGSEPSEETTPSRPHWSQMVPGGLSMQGRWSRWTASGMLTARKPTQSHSWGMIRSPLFYEWFPFWNAFCRELGITLTLPPVPSRRQFEKGTRLLRVETCLPVKAMAGQLADLMESGVKTIFHPTILNEPPWTGGKKPVAHCPYIQASSQFFKGRLDVEWKEPVVSHELDPDAFFQEHVSFAKSLGFSRKKAGEAYRNGMEALSRFETAMKLRAEKFLDDLGPDEQALLILGKPYHTADPFLNMNLGSLFRRLGVKAIPADLLAHRNGEELPAVNWKYQGGMVRAAARISEDARMFPVLISFFGCGPDPFTVRHISDALGEKPLLVLEMDEHTSRAGIITRIEAFLERIRAAKKTSASASGKAACQKPAHGGDDRDVPRGTAAQGKKHSRQTDLLYVPYIGDQSYAFAAGACAVGIEAKVMPPPDEESGLLGRQYMVGGECYPYALILGDYLKLARAQSPDAGRRSIFYIVGSDACRLGQYPAYVEKVRTRLGCSMRVVSEPEEMLNCFGLSPVEQHRVLLKVWQGMNAYDLLIGLFLQIRPLAKDPDSMDGLYVECRDKLFSALSSGRVKEGMEEVLNEVYRVPIHDALQKPVVAVTGDYYTRVVPFANNDVFQSIEELGGVLWCLPTFSDSFRMSALKKVIWSLFNARSRDLARNSLLYLSMAVSELSVKSGRAAQQVPNVRSDLLGRQIWGTVSPRVDTRLPGGITAPMATALQHLELGADGVLNLITLNCSYGTVVTAALMREMTHWPGVALLTLVYEGLKKTNEKTRLEAFMEQVRNHFSRKSL